MHKRISKTLVTGGAGFIGSEFVRQAVKKGQKIVVVDKLTYAGDLQRLKEVEDRYTFYKTDICQKAKLEAVIKKEKPQQIIHFAAETHVDRSIQNVFGKRSLCFVKRRSPDKRTVFNVDQKNGKCH